MQFSKWLAGLAPCIILLFILSLSVVEVESKRGRKRHRSRGGRYGPRHGGPSGGSGRPPPSGVEVRPPKVGGRIQVIAPIAPTPHTTTTNNQQACPKPSPFADVKGNITKLWDEIHHLSHPIHIHVHGGHAHHDGHSPHGRSPNRYHHPHSSGHRHSRGSARKGHTTPGGKGHHHYTPGGKGHHHYTPGGKGHHHYTPGGKRHHHYTPGGKRRHPHSPGGKSGKGRHHPHPHHSPGKGTPTPGRKGPGHSPYHKGHSPSHETHIHIHITLDPDKDKFEELLRKHFDDYQYARCDLVSPEKGSPLTGTVLMRQKFKEPIEVKVNISGMAGFRPAGLPADDPSQHGLHVHEFADSSQGCTSFGPHYNPENTTHGEENDEDSHAGDWGNIECDKDGKCEASMNITNAELLGPSSVIGRGIVLHKMEDDLGQGGNKGSLATGNAGKRIACCAIVRTPPPSDADDW